MTKLGVYGVLGIVVLAVLFLWSQRAQTSGPTDDGATATSAAPTAPVVQVEDGSTVPSGPDAVTTRDGTSSQFVDVPVEDPVSGRVRGP